MFEIPRGFRTGLVFSATSGGPYDITTGRDNNGDSQVTDRPSGVTRNTGQGPGYFTVDLRVTKLLRLPRLLDRGRMSRASCLLRFSAGRIRLPRRVRSNSQIRYRL